MPELSIDQFRARFGSGDYRFVPENYAPVDRFFVVVRDPTTILHMRRLLGAAAARCQEKHEQPCGCPAQRVCHAPDRTRLVQHDLL